MAEKDRKYILLGLKIAGDFGATIAVPIVLFAYAGKWLDDRFLTAPWLTIAGFILAALISGAMIYKKAKRYGEEYRKLNKN